MAKILGLDLGTNSIGWAVVDDKEQKILGVGVRIFPEGLEPTTIGQGEKEKSKNASRRDNRQLRRNYYRDRLRRIKLLSVLIGLKMCPLNQEDILQWKNYDPKKGQAGKVFPQTPEFINWLKLNPYYLRHKAITENITLLEFGRILYHFIQRRGFLSNRKGKDDGAIYKGKENITGIDETKDNLINKTLGSYLYSILPKENKPFKLITDEDGKELRARGRYTLRDMYITEFDAIWTKQATQLGLDNLTFKNTKITNIEGSIFNKRNKTKIEHLQQSKGKENVKIEGNKITIKIEIPLKEYLAGKIWRDENGELKFKSSDSVLFYQRPLRSQKGLLSKCTLEGRKFFDEKNNKWIIVGPTPCPISHPRFEEFRALQFINNIEYGAKKRLDDNQRRTILQLMNKKTNFEFKEIPKELKLTYEKFNYEDETKVPGNNTISKLKPLFKDEIWEKHSEDIWHCVKCYEDNDKLLKKLSSEFGLEEKHFDKLSKITLKDDYSSVSIKAINNILPFLYKGYKFSDAVILGGVRNAFNSNNYDRWNNFAESHQEIEKDIIAIIKRKDNKEGDAIDQIKTYLTEKCGFEKDDKNFRKLYHHSQEIEKQELKPNLDKIENLRNPIVQQGLNELRRLVNTLLEQYHGFDRIKIEFGRDLKVGKKRREEIGYKIKENNKKNEEARQKLVEYGLAQTRDNIQKYLLYKEIQDKVGTAVCPYTNKAINISDLLGKENLFQIEHIFPRSTSLDDSFANKTLCESKFNGLKGNLTPYQFYQLNQDSKLWGGAKSWEDIEQRAFKLLPYAKAKRFTVKVLEKSNFIERQLNDTRYLSKKAREILSQVCSDVKVLPGALTAELRHLWGLNNILQPVQVYNFKDAIIDENESIKHWVVFDKEENPISFHPINNKKPKLGQNETTITGNLKKNAFQSKYLNHVSNYMDLPDGEYWKIIQLKAQPDQLVKMFIEKPECIENELILRGKVEKKSFNNETIGSKIKANTEDGTYWAKFKVKGINFEIPQDKKLPNKSQHQILLYGEVRDAVFTSYIYKCKAHQGDGKYWAIVDLETDNVEFISSMAKMPEKNDNQILITGSISENGIFSSDIDYEHFIKTSQPQGKYWALFTILHEGEQLYPFLNFEPKPENEQKVLEGSVWVDKYTGEIKFDPKKNRDDHRHHAIDAITIALTEQSYLQKLSTYNANKDEKLRGRPYEKPDFPEPWQGFFDDAKKAAAQILISIKKNNRVLTRINKTIIKNGKKYLSTGYAASGQLHKEFVFGKRKAPDSEEAFHIRKSIESLQTEKQIEKIVDKRIRSIILQAKQEEKKLTDEIKKLEIARKKTKTEIEEQNINDQISEIKKSIKLLYTLPNKNGEPIPIKTVRIKENIGNAQKLKNKLVYADKKKDFVGLNQYVNPRNNHHVAIYKKEDGTLFDQVVTLWEAVERKKQGLPVIDKNPKDGSKFITSLQINDMFILGLTVDQINWTEPNQELLSRYMYRVQKTSEGDYSFRHHLSSTVNNPEDEIRIASFKAWILFNPIKVMIDNIGKIQLE